MPLVASYLPTLQTSDHWIMHEARPSVFSTLVAQKMAIVSMPVTPQRKNLPSAKQEVDELRKLLPPDVRISEALSKTKTEVLALLKDSQIAHFACHGVSHVDPSQS